MPKKGIFMVLSRPRSDSPEDVEAYNKWYDEVHTRDSLLLPGFVKARRFKLSAEQLMPGKAGDPGFDYVALYEIDDVERVPDARALIPRLAEISAEFLSPALDGPSVRAFILEQIAEITEPTALADDIDWTPDRFVR
jgi:hypothetical protein